MTKSGKSYLDNVTSVINKILRNLKNLHYQ